MGDYYKYKKILVILMIVSCGFSIIKNIFKTKVEASEAVEVTPVWNDGTYTYQSDNQILTLRQNQIDIQDALINWFYQRYQDENLRPTARNLLNIIKNNVMTSTWGGSDTHYVWFGRSTESVNNSNDYGYYFQVTRASLMTNIVYADATLNSGYKLLSVPFYSHSRSSGNSLRYINVSDCTTYTITSGTALMPVAEVGCYSTRWLELWVHYGLISNAEDYNSVLSSIEETNELNYTQNYYTHQVVQNTYSYLNSENVDSISSTGITQPQVTEPDISDAFDSLSDLLTNDNATTKFFTFTLPNGSNHVFALSPDFLRTSLTRVGGGQLVIIIETLWYIGLYGLMIFTGLKIIGALLSGDLDAVTGVLSPVNSVVNSSLEVTGAFRTAGGDQSSFRIRKG